MPHRACFACGFYKGKQIITVLTRQEKQQLKKDKKNFSKNDLPAIEESNRRKSEVLQLLNTLAESISQPDQSASELGSESQQELNDLAKELKSEIAACYKYIATNSTVVFANLQQLKELRDKLSSNCSVAQGVYDDKGSIK